MKCSTAMSLLDAMFFLHHSHQHHALEGIVIYLAVDLGDKVRGLEAGAHSFKSRSGPNFWISPSSTAYYCLLICKQKIGDSNVVKEKCSCFLKKNSTTVCTFHDLHKFYVFFKCFDP